MDFMERIWRIMESEVRVRTGDDIASRTLFCVRGMRNEDVLFDEGIKRTACRIAIDSPRRIEEKGG